MVHVNFSIESRDVFRANLNMGRHRLLLGIAIALTPTTVLLPLLLFLGEQEIALELSPLFIVLPLAAVGGQIIRLHATCRKYVKSLSLSQRKIGYLFKADLNGYDFVIGDSFGHIAWSDILKIVERPNYFLLYLNRFNARIIPKRGFQQESDITAFREIVRSKVGTVELLREVT